MRDAFLAGFFSALLLSLAFTGWSVWAFQLGVSVSEVIFHSF